MLCDKPYFLCLLVIAFSCTSSYAQDHTHDHSDHGNKVAEPPPRIFLDKSARVVWYQLNRLTNERLLMVERAMDDPKYAPVYTAILIRAGMANQDRDEALKGLIAINKSDAVAELLAALKGLDDDDKEQQRVGRQLAAMLLQQPMRVLLPKVNDLQAATKEGNRLMRSAGYAGLITAGKADVAQQAAHEDDNATLDYLSAVALVPSESARASLRESVVEMLGEQSPANVRKAAITALASVPAEVEANFQIVAPLVDDEEFRTTAVRMLLRVPKNMRDAATSKKLVDVLVKYAETTPAAERTADEFVDAMQLADQLIALVPSAEARAYRDRLRAVTVRVVRIHTVEEEMRYDTRYFAVEAGRPVQVVLTNEDLMPHNFVITVPGALKEVAIAGALLTQNPGGTPYVPKTEKVLYHTDMVQPHQQVRLTFTAPTEPGEYPYVCTFPRHWMRMYGVMIVVDDLDAWLRDPKEPVDPTGNNRSFVQNWTFEDLSPNVTDSLRGRSLEIGAKIFKEATCSQCHKIAGQGGAVGPELTEVFKRWKGDHLGILREIVDPSHKIDPKFAVQVVITVDGRVVSGIVASEDKDSISMIVNPEAPEPTVIRRDDIDEIEKSSKSLMPKALLDRFTRDEIFELLSYLVHAESLTSGTPTGN
ncbi:MAG: c-type cytochrome [Planctomycetaceae bacterium]|nr:c-type cytochrome [Planctomycetales bacterium]MCB9927406.1 c-type cytochrome [Planctomycetaceae bacterium]